MLQKQIARRHSWSTL